MKKVKKYAEGGDTEDAELEDNDATPNEQEESQSASQQPAQDQTEDQELESSDDTQAQSEAQPQQTTQAQKQPAQDQNVIEDDGEPQQAQQAAQNPQVAQAGAQLVPVSADELRNEQNNFQADLVNGHITPKHYRSLMEGKGFFGKIGTLFGLILAGAGSGLSGQPNILAEMMNREIGNDLEAQKLTAENKLNLYHLNQQNEYNKANIAQLQKQGMLTESQAKLMAADANTKAYTLTRMQANQLALHHLVQNVQKMAEGPDKTNAMNQLATLSKQVEGENYDLADRAATMSGLTHAIFEQNTKNSKIIGQNQPQQQNDPEQEFQNNQTRLRLADRGQLADINEQHHIPGIPGRSSIPLTAEDRQHTTSALTFQNQLDNFMNWTKTHSGDLNPKDRAYGASLAANLQGAYRVATRGGVYKEGEQNFINKVINENPTKFFNSIRVLPQLQAVKKSTSMELDQHLKSLGFEGYQPTEAIAKNAPKQTPENKSAPVMANNPQEGETVVTNDGRNGIFKNGKWYYTDKIKNTASTGQ